MSQARALEISPPAARTNEAVKSFFDRYYTNAEISRVLLVNPPDADSSLFAFRSARRGTASNFPPYGLALLAQHLRAVDVDVRILNLNNEVLKRCHMVSSEEEFHFDTIWQSRLDREIAEFRPELIGVTCMFTMTHDSLKRVCDHAARSGIPVAIGGVHVTNDVECVLDDIKSVKVAFLREADETIKLFIRAIRRQVDPSELAQLIVIEDGERHRLALERQPTAKETDVIPAFDLVGLPELSRFGTIGSFHFLKPHFTRFATSISSRGCRGQCTFCSVRNFNGRGVRQRSLDSLLDELELLQNEYGIGHIMWLDDDLFKDHARIIALFNGMVKRGLTLTWDASNGVMASSCTDEVVAAAAASGCLALILGIESGNARILRQIRKPATVDVYLRAAETLQRYEEINSSAYLIIGFPGETISMIKDTIDVSLEMNLDWYRIKTLQPLPNTDIYAGMLDDNLLRDVEKKAVRYITGPYGRSHDADRSVGARTAGRGNVFDSIPMDSIPTAGQLDEIWFYMNYKLNYERVHSEARPIKLKQQYQFVECICDVIAPDNALALYTKGILQIKLMGEVEGRLVEKLENQLRSSPYWRDRFDAFGLAVGDLTDTSRGR